jgi:hypothetical protein
MVTKEHGLCGCEIVFGGRVEIPVLEHGLYGG